MSILVLLLSFVSAVLAASSSRERSLYGIQAPRLYHCCCPSCRVNGKLCFSCRNAEYYCNCDECSCFPSAREIIENEEDEDSSSLIAMLLRGGGHTSSRMKKSHTYADYDY